MSLTRRGKNSLQYRVKLHYRIRSNYSHVIRRGFENSRCCNSKGEYIAASIIQKKIHFSFHKWNTSISCLFFLFHFSLIQLIWLVQRKEKKKDSLPSDIFRLTRRISYFIIRYFPLLSVIFRLTNEKDPLYKQ